MLIDHPHFPALAEFELHRYMGIDFHMSRDGKSHISFLAKPEMLTPAPALHAGFFYTACDLAAYVALMSQLSHTEGAVTHDLHVSVMRSVGPGKRVDIYAEVAKRGRTLAFIDARAMSEDRLLATARVTKSMMAIDPH